MKFADGRTAAADIIGRDPTTDLAVIKARAVSGLTPATLGSTDTVHVGDTVLAIGSPLGLDGSVSADIVSALHRPVELGTSDTRLGAQQPATVTDAIQTDAAINPGNSGGPLVDGRGRVIGINSAIATLGGERSGSIGVGFAIPVDEAAKVANALISGQRPAHAVLGVRTTATSAGGALVADVTPASAAAAAGLRAGDVITAVGDRRVENPADLAAAVRGSEPGDRVRVTYLRDGTTRTTLATLGSATG